jgi:hypothetical protein
MHQASDQASCLRCTVLTLVKADALDRNERACCICFQPFGPTESLHGRAEVPVQLPCGHVFGEECISIWARSSNSCPLCRKKVLDVDKCSANTRFPSTGSATTQSSRFTTQDDVWLDEETWNTSFTDPEHAVSYADIETLIEYYTRDLSNVDSDYQSQRSPETQICGEHRDVCHCHGGRETRNVAVPHGRLTPPATTRPRPMDIDNLDLVQLGSQFAELNYR